MKPFLLRAQTGLLFGWGVLTLGAFWQFEGRYLRPVSRPAGASMLAPETQPPSPLPLLRTDAGEFALTANQPVTLLNFWSPSCGCSRFMESHVRQLVTRYGPQGVRFVTIIQDTDKGSLAAWRARNITTPAVVDTDGAIARSFGVWAAPAAVLLDRQGRVVYVGGYNVARFCDAEQTAFAAQALQATLEGRKPVHARLPFYGCQVAPSPR